MIKTEETQLNELGELLEKYKKSQDEIATLTWQLDEALAAIRSQEGILGEQSLFQTRIWFKSVPGNNDFSMFVNQAPIGGFEYKILDFEPKDTENYTPMFVHNFSVSDLQQISDEHARYKKALKALKDLAQLKHNLLVEEIINEALEGK